MAEVIHRSMIERHLVGATTRGADNPRTVANTAAKPADSSRTLCDICGTLTEVPAGPAAGRQQPRAHLPGTEVGCRQPVCRWKCGCPPPNPP
jgi:hypothetical protein